MNRNDTIEDRIQELELENKHLKGQVAAYKAVTNTIIGAVFGAGIMSICLLLFA